MKKGVIEGDNISPIRETKQEMSLLHREGNIAADYLETLLDIADIEGDIEIATHDGIPYLSLESEDDHTLNSLIGKNGEILEALQELTRLNVFSLTGNRSWLILDINHYREKRKIFLQQEVSDAIAAVRRFGQPVHLPPTNAYERKIVHHLVNDFGMNSASEGEADARHVVISTATANDV